MKSNLLVIFLLIACVGLGAFAWMQNQKHAEAVILNDTKATNDYIALENKLKEEILVRTSLETNLAATQLRAANDLADAESKLSTTYSNLQKAMDDAKLATNALAKAAAQLDEKNKTIADLTQQNSDLDKVAGSLRNEITNLNAKIADTMKQLADSKGENKTLTDELAQLEEQKENLERRLSDVVALKAQVRELQDDLATAHRITWIQSGVYNNMGKKGGQLLTSQPKPAPRENSASLDVDIHQGGAVRINSAAPTNTTSTNTPSAAVSPGR
jgi:chromosome segregation ATPase